MSVSSDPSFTDTAALIKSVQRDLGEALKRQREADGFLREAQNTMWELSRRAEKDGDLRTILSIPAPSRGRGGRCVT